MRLAMACSQCPPREMINYVELRDDAYYEVECLRGHRTSTILTEHKFVILFESGAMALLDGILARQYLALPLRSNASTSSGSERYC